MTGVNMVLGAAGLALGLAAGAAPSVASAPVTVTVTVTEAWATPPLVAGRPLAAYLTLVNPGPEEAVLVGAETPIAKRAAIHTHSRENGVVRMRAAGPVTIPAGGKVRFQPGGLHLMLFDPNPGLVPGTIFPLHLRFGDGTGLDTRVTVRPLGWRPGTAGRRD